MRRTFHFAMLFIAVLLAGCASTEETALLKDNMSSVHNELIQFQNDTNRKLSDLAKEDAGMRKQLVNLYTATESKDEKIKSILGKLDELDYQLRTYWSETKSELAALKKTISASQGPEKSGEQGYEASYREAFDAFQRKAYEEAAAKFSSFVDTYAGTPLVPNAYYWLGESYLNMKNYEKAILSFQEVIDKYPNSDKAPRALLSQAEAFDDANDKKSSMTVLKKVMELFPKSEEAAIAERKLRGLSP